MSPSFKRKKEEDAGEGYSHDPQQRFNDDHITTFGFALEATYTYTTAAGVVLYQVLRYHHRLIKGLKTFMLRRTKVVIFRHPSGPETDPKDIKDWWHGQGPVKVIYRWPEVAARTDEAVYFCEGEKDADRLSSLGLLATAIAGGNWSETAAEALRDRDVVVLEDNDEPGRENAEEAVEKLTDVARSIKVLRLPGLGHKEDVSDWLDAGHTREELETEAAAAAAVQVEGVFSVLPHDFPAAAELEMWDWLYDRHLLRDTVSCTVAMGGTGKSSMAIIQALAMASGKALLGVEVPRPLRVCLINLEDNRLTINKRIEAAMKHYCLEPADISDRLFTKAKGEIKLKIASQPNGRTVVRNEPLIRGLIKFLTEQKIDVLSVDPFVKTHGINENDNDAIQAAVECYDDIAEAARCSVHLWHHTRKSGGGEVTIESARGAIAFVDACRSANVLETMTRAEGQKLKIERPIFYFREFNGKRNFAPPSDQSTWYRLVGVEIENGGPLFGDSVGVVETWLHPGAKETELSPELIERIRAEVGTELKWREHSSADAWVGKGIAPALGLNADEDKEEIKAVVRKLIKAGVLRIVSGRNAKREIKAFVVASAPSFRTGAAS